MTMLIMGQTPADAPAGTWGMINWLGVLCIVPLTVLFAPMGANLGAKMDSVKLKKVFAVVLLITGVRMLMQSIGL